MSAFGLSMVANFREMELFKIHMVGALTAFGFGVVYCWLQTIMSFQMHPLVNNRQMAFFRLFLSSLMTVTFVTSSISGPIARSKFHGNDPTNWHPDEGGFGLHLVSTICEWISALALDFYMLTYVRELQVRPTLHIATHLTFYLKRAEDFDDYPQSHIYYRRVGESQQRWRPHQRRRGVHNPGLYAAQSESNEQAIRVCCALESADNPLIKWSLFDDN